jgi:Pyruvate/2-oxoacid:ferredoxin oxidoreductase delta subunit
MEGLLVEVTGAAGTPKGYRPPEAKHHEACTSCESCMIFCPDLAIAVKGKKSKGGEKR